MFVLRMYSQGFFPMAEAPDRPLNWYYPERRGIIPLDDRFHVSRSLRRRVRSGDYRVTYDLAFQQVLEACAQRERSWINEEYQEFFSELYEAGLAHSAEAWRGDELVGGLYGLSMGGVFIGESMFSRAPDASKVCLVRLVERLRLRYFALLDTQVINNHTAQFGAFEVPHRQYITQLTAAIALPRDFGPPGLHDEGLPQDG